jgi:emfourin
VRIRVERSGGFGGISFSHVMEAKDLPSYLVQTARNMIKDKNISSLPLKSWPRGAADHYTYKISIQDGTNLKVIECNQFNIKDDLKSLIIYIERYSKKPIVSDK